MPGDMELRIREYHESLSREFRIIKDRVRYLIGDTHWGEDGRYKEVILVNFLKKFLPSNLTVGTGFIMNGNNYDDISSQIDIIVYENDCPTIFKEGDFVIVNSKNVVGIIEVKSKFYFNKFGDTLKKYEKIGELINRKIFNGIFYFDANDSINFDENHIKPILKSALENSKGKVNHIAIGPNKFIRFWENGNPELNNGKPCMSLYELHDLSFSYFMSNLIEMTYSLCKSYQNNIDEFKWFLYPIEGTKEVHRVNNIELFINA